MQEIHFFQFSALKIFYAINADAELGLATPLTTAKELHLFRTSLRAHQTGDFSDTHSNFTLATDTSQTSSEMVQVMRSFSRTTVNSGQMRCCQAICQ